MVQNNYFVINLAVSSSQEGTEKPDSAYSHAFGSVMLQLSCIRCHREAGSRGLSSRAQVFCTRQWESAQNKRLKPFRVHSALPRRRSTPQRTRHSNWTFFKQTFCENTPSADQGEDNGFCNAKEPEITTSYSSVMHLKLLPSFIRRTARLLLYSRYGWSVAELVYSLRSWRLHKPLVSSLARYSVILFCRAFNLICLD